MKLTKREKILGSILAVLVFIWLYVTFVFTPLHNKISDLESDAVFLEKQVEISKDMIKNVEAKEKELILATNSVQQMAKPLFSSMYQEKVIYILSRLIDDNEINIKNMNFNFDIFAASDEEAEVENDDTVSEEKIEGLQGMEIDIPFLANYDNLKMFLNSIRNYDKYINIVSLNLSETGQELLRGSVKLRFYAYPVILANLDDGIVINNDDEDYIVQNPFEVFPKESVGNLELDSSNSPLGDVTLSVDDEYVLFDNFENTHTAIASANRSKIEVYKDNDSKEGAYSNFVGFDFPDTVNLKQVFLDVNPSERIITSPFKSGRIDLKSYGTSSTQVLISYYNKKGLLKESTIFNSVDWYGWKTGEFKIDASDFPITFKNIVFRSKKTGYLDEKYNIDEFILSYDIEVVNSSESINSAFTEHKVLVGDTLYSISKKYYGTGNKVDVIKKYNNLSSNTLKVGKILIIPNDIR